MRKAIAATVALWTVMSFGSSAVGGDAFSFTVDPTSGPPGTSVTVTAFACGEEEPLQVSGANGVTGGYLAASGQLIVFVAGWGEPFESGFIGGFNDTDGIATATFEVPNVGAGAYVVEADCVPTCSSAHSGSANACAQPSLRATQFGPYPDGSFTVTAPASTPADTADPVEGQANTVG